MKNIYLIVAIIIINCTQLIAQPGYLGKTFSVGYDFNTSILISGISYKGNQNSFASFNPLHALRIDKVTSRKGSMGLMFGYNRTGLYDMDETPPYYYTLNHSPYKLESYKIGANFRTYYRDDANLAPFGQYFELGIGTNYNTTIDKVIDDIISTQFVPYLSFAFGTQRVYSNRYLFDFSVRFTLYPTFLSALTSSDDYYYNSNPSQTVLHEKFVESINKNAKIRLQALDILTFKLGIGALVK